MNGDRPPRVAIGMPVRNGGAFIREALDSLLAQDFGDFEVLISDNASEDTTEEICRAYAERDSRIRYERNPTNLGAAPNFNRVFERSRSPLFVWAAHDDRWEPTFIKRCVEVLDEDPAVVLCYGRARMLRHDGTPIGEYRDPLGEVSSPRPDHRFRQVLRSLDRNHAVFGVIRSEALVRTGGWRRELDSPRLLVAELALQGTLRQVPELLFHNRLTRGVQRNRTWWDARNKYRLPLQGPRLIVAHLGTLWRSSLPPPHKAMLSLQILAKFTALDLKRAKWAVERWLGRRPRVHEA